MWGDEVMGWPEDGGAQDPLGVASTKVRTKSLKELLNSFLRTCENFERIDENAQLLLSFQKFRQIPASPCKLWYRASCW